MKGFAFTAAELGKVLVYIGGSLSRPDRYSNDQVINSGKIRRAGLIADFMKKSVFSNFPGIPDSLRGSIRTNSASSRRARVVATFPVCPFQEKYAIRIRIDTPCTWHLA